MEELWWTMRDMLDAIYFHLVAPLFYHIGKGLEALILRPLDLLGFPLWLQICIIALITSAISIVLKHLLKVDQKEEEFRSVFQAKKAVQENFKQIEDWRVKKLLYETTDEELDELYNNYLARRFALFGIVYLLPIFLTLFWLDSCLCARDMIQRTGSPFVIEFSSRPFGIEGISVPLLFLSVYFGAQLLLWIWLKKKKDHILGSVSSIGHHLK